MSWEIEFCENSPGQQPVRAFIASLKPEWQAKLARILDMLEELGPGVGVPCSPCREGADNLLELRVPCGRQPIRVVFFAQGNSLVALHAYASNAPKMTRAEFRTALRRLIECGNEGKRAKWGEFREELLKNPDVKRVYDELEQDCHLGRIIALRRAQLGMSQAELARKAGVFQPTIARLESGVYNPSLGLLRKVAKALGMELKVTLD